MKPVLVCRHACLRSAVAPGVWQPALPESILRLSLAKRPGYELFEATLEGLRQLCPTPFPTIVRTSDLAPEMDGCCYRTGCRFVIHLDRGLDCERAVDTLLHEWGHARGWSHMLDAAVETDMDAHDFEQLSHGGEFGLAYAEVWRVFSGVIVPTIQACRELQDADAG